jgi:hypothetical protein
MELKLQMQERLLARHPDAEARPMRLFLSFGLQQARIC